MKRTLNNKGFTLVELLLAVAVSTIVMGALTALMIYSSRSTKLTNEKITLQNEIKDAMNHIESYCMEAETATWQELDASGGKAKVLTVYERRDDVKNISSSVSSGAVSVEVDQVETLDSYAYSYWQLGDRLYFGKCSKGGNIKLNALKGDDIYLLADHVKTFSCEVKKNEASGKDVIVIQIDGQLNSSKYSSSKTVYIRNQ